MAAQPRYRVGAVLRDKWRLDAFLGEGGMATVYAGTHRNGMRGAIKILHASATADTQRRFLREGYVANRVNHPGAVRVLDDDRTEDGHPYLVMELLDGELLKAKWKRLEGRLPPHEVADVAIEVLDVLIAAHAAGIVHRDVKPDNVFITTSSGIKLLDFGIARLRESQTQTSFTQTGTMMGTPAYMAPEQALARWEKVGPHTDVFAVGATMWTLLTGSLVHEAETLPELLIAAATTHARPIATVMPSVPARLAKVIDRALAFEAGSRWQSAREMQAALRQARSAMLVHTTRMEAISTTSAAVSAPAARGPIAPHDPAFAEAPTAPATTRRYTPTPSEAPPSTAHEAPRNLAPATFPPESDEPGTLEPAATAPTRASRGFPTFAALGAVLVLAGGALGVRALVHSVAPSSPEPEVTPAPTAPTRAAPSASETGASETGASETGASETGASEPDAAPAGPGASEAIPEPAPPAPPPKAAGPMPRPPHVASAAPTQTPAKPASSDRPKYNE